MNNQYVYGSNSGVFIVDQLGNFVWMIIPIVLIAAIPSCTNLSDHESNQTPYKEAKLSSKEISTHIGFCGNYSIKEEWNLTPPPGVPGVIIQHIEYKSTMHFMSNDIVTSYNETQLFGRFKSYTEYWSVLANWNNDTTGKYFNYNGLSIGYVDEFSFNTANLPFDFNCSKGSISLQAEAQFIPNEGIPSTASQMQNSPSGALPFMIGRH